MDFNASLQKLLDQLEFAWADRRITLVELKACLLEVAEFACLLAVGLKNAGIEKKVLVLHWVGSAFDILWPSLPFPLYAIWLKPLLTPVIRTAILAFANADIEFIYTRIIAKKPTTTPEVQS